MSIIVKKGDVNIQTYAEPGSQVTNNYKGPVYFGSGVEMRKDPGRIPTDAEVRKALECVLPRITNSRMWFSIYRPLVMRQKVKNGLFDQFLAYVRSFGLDLPKPIDVRDLQSKMDVQSFQKDIEQWNPTDAPVSGKTFLAYYDLARDFLSLLDSSSDTDEDEGEKDGLGEKMF